MSVRIDFVPRIFRKGKKKIGIFIYKHNDFHFILVLLHVFQFFIIQEKEGSREGLGCDLTRGLHWSFTHVP